MEREAIGIGATIEEAQQAACRQLGMETHEVEFEVLQMPEKKKYLAPLCDLRLLSINAASQESFLAVQNRF